jgi:hypothetical protein
MPDDDGRITEDGFEYDGTFYRWHISDVGKDLMLIDRFSGMAIDDFFAVIDDDHERTRAPILLSLIACSIRHEHPDWTIERITRMVMQLQLSAVTFIAGDEGDVADSPLPESERPKEETTSGESFSSADDVFSRSSIPRATSRSATSSEIRA